MRSEQAISPVAGRSVSVAGTVAAIGSTASAAPRASEALAALHWTCQIVLLSLACPSTPLTRPFPARCLTWTVAAYSQD